MKSVYIIAEAGVNHNGSLDRAIEMIDVAAAAGVDAVKFQTFRTENLVTRAAAKANYQQASTEAAETQFEMLKKLEFTRSDFEALQVRCENKKIDFLSTPFDLDSIDVLCDLGIEKWKLPSGEITNLPYLRKIGSLGHEVILSTGMCTMDEISDALNVLEAAGTLRKNISVLHCNTEYPTPMRDVNLSAIGSIVEAFPGLKSMGYSDHTLGIEVAIAAVGFGARIIEKHFTLDNKLPGPDHTASLEPDSLISLVECVRNIEDAIGDGVKRPSPSEQKNILTIRKGIYAAEKIECGELFSEENIVVKRPAGKISPMRYDELIGKPADRDYSVDEEVVG
jgi:N,N'-diacetyllegionaminate synthase